MKTTQSRIGRANTEYLSKSFKDFLFSSFCERILINKLMNLAEDEFKIRKIAQAILGRLILWHLKNMLGNGIVLLW